MKEGINQMEIQIDKQAYQVGLKINKQIKWLIDFIQKALDIFLMLPMVYFLLLSIDSLEFSDSWHVGGALSFLAVVALPLTLMDLCFFTGKLHSITVKFVLDKLGKYYSVACGYFLPSGY